MHAQIPNCCWCVGPEDTRGGLGLGLGGFRDPASGVASPPPPPPPPPDECVRDVGAAAGGLYAPRAGDSPLLERSAGRRTAGESGAGFGG